MLRYRLVGGGLQVASPYTPPAPKRYETNMEVRKQIDSQALIA